MCKANINITFFVIFLLTLNALFLLDVDGTADLRAAALLFLDVVGAGTNLRRFLRGAGPPVDLRAHCLIRGPVR